MIRSWAMAALATCIVALGCTDRVTGPEAVEIVRTLEGTFRGEVTFGGDSLGRDMSLMMALSGWHNLLGGPRRSTATSSVTVLREGTPVEYRGIVIERTVILWTGIQDRPCRWGKKTWMLLLWRLADPTEGLVFEAQSFDQPITPDSTGCPVSHPRLTMARVVPDSSGRFNPRQALVWVGVAGAGNVSPAKETEDCGLLREDQRMLFEKMATTCRFSRYHVRLRTVLVPGVGPRRTPEPGRRRFTVEVPEVEVAGVSYTVHCDERPQAETCRPYHAAW